MEAGSALANVLAASTLEAIQAPGAVDAVVVGSGAAGGLASALLTEAGLRVLVLEAGSAKAAAPLPQRRGAKALRRFTEEFQRVRGNLSAAGRRKSVRNAAETVVGDRDFAYVTPRDYPFEWVRARRLGGRMVDPGHGRQYYRLAADDFAPSDGRSPAWPLMPGELAPWYALVEQRLKLAGARDGVPWLPDSELEYFLEPNADEIALQSAIAKRWPMSKPIVGRFAPPLSGVAAAAKTGQPVCPRSRCRAEGSRPFRASAWDRVGRPKRPLRARRGAADLSVRLDPGIDAPAIAVARRALGR